MDLRIHRALQVWAWDCPRAEDRSRPIFTQALVPVMALPCICRSDFEVSVLRAAFFPGLLQSFWISELVAQSKVYSYGKVLQLADGELLDTGVKVMVWASKTD